MSLCSCNHSARFITNLQKRQVYKSGQIINYQQTIHMRLTRSGALWVFARPRTEAEIMKQLCIILLLISPCANSGSKLELDQNSGYSLTVDLSAATPVGLESEMLISFELTNNGDDSLWVLPWGTPLEGFFTRDIFAITLNNQLINYLGPIVKRAAPVAADFLEMAPGDSRQVQIDLREGYEIDLAGDYQVTLHASTIAVRVNDRSFLLPFESEAVRIHIQN